MKKQISNILTNIIRLLVGVLFIISGFVKIVDPTGTAIKFEEYFYVFEANFASFFGLLVPAAMFFSVTLTALEIVLGIAIIIRYKSNLTAWALLALIVIFTILTGYSAVTNEVTDCGCFGDAVKLTPNQSFIKDIVLTLLIAYLFVMRKSYAKKDTKTGHIAIALGTSACLFFAYYNLAHLPVIDFRQYKVGNNIYELSHDATPAVIEYTVEKDGQQYQFTEYPSDPSYKYVSYKEISPAGLPTINDFNLFDEQGEERTEEILKGTHLLFISKDLAACDISKAEEYNSLLSTAQKAAIQTAIVFGDSHEELKVFMKKAGILTVPGYTIDEVVIKAMIRANPGFMLLKDGVVIGKWHHNDTPTFEEIANLAK